MAQFVILDVRDDGRTYASYFDTQAEAITFLRGKCDVSGVRVFEVAREIFFERTVSISEIPPP